MYLSTVLEQMSLVIFQGIIDKGWNKQYNKHEKWENKPETNETESKVVGASRENRLQISLSLNNKPLKPSQTLRKSPPGPLVL